MPPVVDPRVAALVDRAPAVDRDEDEDELIAQLEEEDDVDSHAYREQRAQQLHTEMTRARQLRGTEHGTYLEVKDEKTVMDLTTSSKLCVVHFFKPDFNRCRIMDSHLETLAERHLDTRFIRINVDNAPFLVTKLQVKMLPCVLPFVDGIGSGRIVGFEGIGRGHDSFSTAELEARLLQANVLIRLKMAGDEGPARASKHNLSMASDEDDDDWD